MNINLEYSEALAELDILLQNLDEKLVQKIPIKFRNFIKNNKSKNYIVKFDVNKKLSKDDLSLKTRELLAYIYRNYLCDENERKEYDSILKSNEIKYQNEIKAKYDVNNFFKNEKKYNSSNMIFENHSLIENKNRNFLKNIFEKIKQFFRI